MVKKKTCKQCNKNPIYKNGLCCQCIANLIKKLEKIEEMDNINFKPVMDNFSKNPDIKKYL